MRPHRLCARPVGARRVLLGGAVKGSPCEDCGDEVTDEDVDQCKEDLDDCDHDDEKALEEYADCAEDLGDGECVSSVTTDQLEEALACFATLSNVSEDCLDFTL